MDTTTPAHFRARRRALGLTQRQLAAEMRVLPSTVARWEQGVNPIPPWADRMLDLLGERGIAA